MNAFPVLKRIVKSILKYVVIIQLFVLKRLINLDKILIHYATRSDIHVTNFRIAHLSLRQPDSKSGGLQFTIGILTIQGVDKGSGSLVDSRNLLVPGNAPAIQNHQ